MLSKSFNDPVTANQFDYLRTELAFSLYNSDKLIEDAKTLEQSIGMDYKNVI